MNRPEVGTIVRHSAKWRRSVGLYTGGPINGKVVGWDSAMRMPIVWWCNRDESDLVRVHSDNLELAPKGGF